jgi:hypothetical protein
MSRLRTVESSKPIPRRDSVPEPVLGRAEFSRFIGGLLTSFECPTNESTERDFRSGCGGAKEDCEWGNSRFFVISWGEEVKAVVKDSRDAKDAAEEPKKEESVRRGVGIRAR